jgi:hypothetical protein
MPRSEDPPSEQRVPDVHAPTPPLVYAAVVAPVAIAMTAVATQPWLPPSDLLRDSQAVAAGHADTSTAYGLLSNLGIAATLLAAGAALLAWMSVRRTGDGLGALLAWAFPLSLAFALDDLLLLHETAAASPWAGHLVTAAYGAAFLAFVGRFLPTIRERLGSGLILLAVAAFAVSALVDLLATPSQMSVVVEDGAKLLGVMAWSAFVVRAALAAIRSTAGTPAPPARVPATPAHDTSRAGTAGHA